MFATGFSSRPMCCRLLSLTSVELCLCDDSDEDPTFVPGKCEFFKCKGDVFAACVRCLRLLCYDHFIEDDDDVCTRHGIRVNNTRGSKDMKHTSTPKKSSLKNDIVVEHQHINVSGFQQNLSPESFQVEGIARECTPQKKKRTNKKRIAKAKRSLGKEYISPETGKVVHARKPGTTCQRPSCIKNAMTCTMFTEEEIKDIFCQYYELGDTQLQREFITRHVKVSDVVQATTKGASRRKKTKQYFFSRNGCKERVCQHLFISTLGISEKQARTAVDKLNLSGFVERDKRGGRVESVIERDLKQNQLINDHIKRFPRVESHYCRATSSKEYLHNDLSLTKMYDIFSKEYTDIDKPSFSMYAKVFEKSNLSFHKPKKDQCPLCTTYKECDDNIKKLALEDRYVEHTLEKEKVRIIKQECKEKLIRNRQKHYVQVLTCNRLFTFLYQMIPRFSIREDYQIIT